MTSRYADLIPPPAPPELTRREKRQQKKADRKLKKSGITITEPTPAPKPTVTTRYSDLIPQSTEGSSASQTPATPTRTTRYSDLIPAPEPVVETKKKKEKKDKLPFGKRYMNFSDKIGEKVAEPLVTDVLAPIGAGIIRSVGSTVGSIEEINKAGKELTRGSYNLFKSPMQNGISILSNKLLRKAQEQPSQENKKGVGETLIDFSEEVMKGRKEITGKEETYLTQVAQAFGSSIPYLLGGLAMKGAGLGAKTSSVVSGGLEALTNGYEDYRTMIKDGESKASARKKALASFGANLALNYATNKLGGFFENTDPGFKNALKRFLSVTIAETSQETLQQLISNITTGNKPTEGLAQTFLVSLPVSGIFGFGSITVPGKPNQAFRDLVNEARKNGVTDDQLVTVVQEATQADPEEIKQAISKVEPEVIQTQEDTAKPVLREDNPYIDLVPEENRPKTTTQTQEQKPITTAREAAKDLVREYVKRGDTIQDIKQGQLGAYMDKYSASVGGFLEGKKIPANKIFVQKVGGETVNETFSLKEIFDEIKNEGIADQVKQEYQGGHQITDSTALPLLDNLDNVISSISSKYGLTKQDRSNITKLRSIISKGENVTIYRVAPKNELNNGDWVTIDKDYAQTIKEQNGGSINTFSVSPEQLFYPNDTLELPSLARFSAFQYKESQATKEQTKKGKQTKKQKVAKLLKDMSIADLESELQQVYAKEPEAEQALYEILVQMEISEPGSRVFTEDGRVIGVPSTFPKWIPENLRSKKLFQKIYDNFKSPTEITFPKRKNAVNQRLLVNEVLDMLDAKLGVDTSGIRADILEKYDSNIETATTDNKGVARSEGRGERTRERVQQKEEEIATDQMEFSRRAPSGSLGSPKGGKKTITKIIERLNQKDYTTPDEVPKDFKLSDRAKEVLREFGVTAYGEKTLPKRMLGVFNNKSKKIRVQAFYDITTVTHEAVHAIDDQISFTEKIIADTKRGADVRKQLTQIYTDIYPGAKATHKLELRLKEGLAVLFENYFYDPATISEKYPDLVDNFIKPTGRYYDPLFTKLVDRMSEIVDDYAKLSSEERIASRIRTGKEVVERKSGFNFRQRMTFEIFDRYEPLKRYSRKAGVSETWDDPTVQAFNIMNKNSIVFNWVKGDAMPILQKDGNFVIEKGSVDKYLKLVKGNEKAFRSYLVARRVFEENNQLAELKNTLAIQEEYLLRKFQKAEGMTPAKLKKIISENTLPIREEIKRLQDIIENDDFSLQDATAVVNKYADQFKEAEEIYDRINKNLITVSEEAGLIDSETANQYRKQKGYASFRRFVDEELQSLGTIKTSSKSKVSSFKERTGSQLDIIDPVYNQIISINEVYSKAMENMLWKKVALLREKSLEVAQRFEQIEAQPAVDAKGRLSFPQEQDPGVIRVFDNGKRKFYKAAPEFLAIAKTLRGREFDAFVQLLRIPSSVFTRLTTSANPLFALGNISVDQFSALSQTKTGLKPVVDPAKSLYSYVTSESGMQAYLALGGKRQTLASYFDLSPDEIATKLTGGQTKLERASGIIDSAIGIFEIPSNISEIMTRYAEYKRSVEKGEPMSVAMYRAAEVTTPFQLSGNFGGRLGQEYIKSIPYLNALLQVLYKFGRATGDNPKRVGSVLAGLLVAGLSSAIFLLKASTQEQRRLISEQPARNLSRYIYLPSPNGKDLIRIRIPEQFGIFTGMAYLYTIEHYDQNKATFNEYLDVVTSAIPEQINITEPKKMALSYIPQAIKPTVLVASNTKVYPEVRPIVPPYVVDKAPEEQYNSYTSRVAKFLGQISHSSPMLIDYWIAQQFGAVGRALTGKLPSVPVYIQEGEYVMSGRSYNRFYDNRDIVKQQYEKMKKNPDEYDYAERQEISLTKKAYDSVSELLSVMRDINKEYTLPEDIRQSAYELLLHMDSTENIVDIRPDVAELRRELNDFKTKNNIH